ncbi:hypothetical protein [Mesoterricola sediminis]|nr:hypothetical protein [Mesoterricola sediminis]
MPEHRMDLLAAWAPLRDLDTCVFTTYGINLQFFEQVILPHLRGRGCRMALVLVDQGQFSRAMVTEGYLPTLLGRYWMALPIRAQGSFHPKASLLLDGRRGSLHVGSHNLTLGGYGGNLELTGHWTLGGEDSGRRPFQEAWGFVRAWAGSAPAVVNHLLDQMQQLHPWLAELDPWDGDLVLFGSRPQGPGLWEQLRDRLPGDVARGYILGPYFDTGLHFLKELLARWPETQWDIAVQPGLSLLEPEARDLGPRVRFHRIPETWGLGPGSSRLVHGKGVLFECAGGSRHWLAGSANPSGPAWLKDAQGRNVNAELVFLRREEAPLESTMTRDLEAIRDQPELDEDDWRRVLAASIQAKARRDRERAEATVWNAVPAVAWLEGRSIRVPGSAAPDWETALGGILDAGGRELQAPAWRRQGDQAYLDLAAEVRGDQLLWVDVAGRGWRLPVQSEALGLVALTRDDPVGRALEILELFPIVLDGFDAEALRAIEVILAKPLLPRAQAAGGTRTTPASTRGTVEVTVALGREPEANVRPATLLSPMDQQARLFDALERHLEAAMAWDGKVATLLDRADRMAGGVRNEDFEVEEEDEAALDGDGVPMPDTAKAGAPVAPSGKGESPVTAHAVRILESLAGWLGAPIKPEDPEALRSGLVMAFGILYWIRYRILLQEIPAMAERIGRPLDIMALRGPLQRCIELLTLRPDGILHLEAQSGAHSQQGDEALSLATWLLFRIGRGFHYPRPSPGAWSSERKTELQFQARIELSLLQLAEAILARDPDRLDLARKEDSAPYRGWLRRLLAVAGAVRSSIDGADIVVDSPVRLGDLVVFPGADGRFQPGIAMNSQSVRSFRVWNLRTGEMELRAGDVLYKLSYQFE